MVGRRTWTTEIEEVRLRGKAGYVRYHGHKMRIAYF